MNSEMAIVSMYGGKGVGKSFLVNCMLEFFDEGQGVSTAPSILQLVDRLTFSLCLLVSRGQ